MDTWDIMGIEFGRYRKLPVVSIAEVKQVLSNFHNGYESFEFKIKRAKIMEVDENFFYATRALSNERLRYLQENGSFIDKDGCVVERKKVQINLRYRFWLGDINDSTEQLELILYKHVAEQFLNVQVKQAIKKNAEPFDTRKGAIVNFTGIICLMSGKARVRALKMKQVTVEN